MSKYVVKNIHNTRVNEETGEVVETVSAVEVTKMDTEPFFLTYSKEIMALYGKSIFNITTKIFWKLLEFAEYNTGKVYVTLERKKEIMQICNTSRSSYDRAVKELVEAGLIKKEGNTYTINALMFWKGDRKTREELKKARLQVTFTPVYSNEN